MGLVETPYEGVGGVVRQHYRASLRGQEPTVGYHLGGSYSRTSDYLPDDEISAQSSPGVHGGINYAKGILTLDVSGRYTVHNLSSVFNPALAATGFSLFTKPQFQPSQIRNQTIGGRLEDSSTSVVEARNHSRYRSLLPGHRAVQAPANHTLGYTPLHSELGANQELCRLQHLSNGRPDSRSSRVSASRRNSSHCSLDLSGRVANARCAEHYRDHSDRPEPSGHLKPQRDDQYWLLHARTTRCRRSPFLHRRSTSRGQETPISAKASAHHYPLAWKFIVRGSCRWALTLKARASFGRSIRAPSPGDKLAFNGTTTLVLANPDLGPERQHGWDAGLDASDPLYGWLGMTYYDQIADDLIQQVFLSATPRQTFQFQNVGRVRRPRVRAGARGYCGSLCISGGSMGSARARVDRLAPNYAGDLRVGDETPGTPRHTAGASGIGIPTARDLHHRRHHVRGNWRYYDFHSTVRFFRRNRPMRAIQS